MKQKVFVCATSHDFVVGGVATYYIRMFKWAIENNQKCVLLLREDCKIDDKLKSDLFNLNIVIITFDIFSSGLHGAREEVFNNNNEIFILTADIHCFLRLKLMERKKRISYSRLLFYVLHPEATRICENKILNYPYKKWFLSEVRDNVIFMDKETTVACEKYYNISLDSHYYYRLGEIIPSRNIELEIQRMKSRKKKSCILTVTRFEFPFKGYLLGLIDSFAQLGKTYPNLELKIIGNGEGKEKVLKKIEELPLDIKNRIRCYDTVPYEELKEYFYKSHIYIGMGTTLLDAAGYSVPSIVATAFQNGNLSAGDFIDEFDNLGGNIELSNTKISSTFEKEICAILNLSDEEYLEYERKSYNIVNHYYNINKIMPEILKKANVSIRIKHMFLLRVYDSFIIILKKVIHGFRRVKKYI